MEHLSVFITIGLFLKVFGECPRNPPDTLVTSCDGATKSGTELYIDFTKINQPCNCIVIPLFDGDLSVKANVPYAKCDAFVKVNKAIIFNCQAKIEFATVKVTKRQSVAVVADYKTDSFRGSFYHCLLFNENGDGSGHVQVSCGEMTTSTPNTSISSSTPVDTSTMLPSMTTNIKDEFTTAENNSVIPSRNIPVNLPEAATEDELNYTILGLAGGGGLILVAVLILIVVIFLSRYKRRNENKNKIPKETLTTFTEHTNNGYEYDRDLPDNPLYHSSQPADEVGYSTVEEQKPSLSDPPKKDSDQKTNIYDTPVKREIINDRDTKQEQPVYATPKKMQSNPVNSTGGDMYAQVNKPNKNAKNNPVRTQNQDGLVYMEVDHSRDMQTENSPYTNDYSSETVAYAEVKTK